MMKKTGTFSENVLWGFEPPSVLLVHDVRYSTKSLLGQFHVDVLPFLLVEVFFWDNEVHHRSSQSAVEVPSDDTGGVEKSVRTY